MLRSLPFLLILSIVPVAAEQSGPMDPGSWFVSNSVAQTEWKPMTASERKKAFLEQALLSPSVYFRGFGSAVGNHLSNKPTEWGQGAEGYFHRAGDRFARFAIQDVITHGTAAALGQEVRYVRCDCKGFFPRFGRALGQNFVTLNSKGNWSPNYGRIGGTFAAEAIGNMWWPERDRNANTVLRGVGVQFGFNTAINLFREYSPEIKRVFKKR